VLKPVRITPPADTPVSVSECKSHLRISHNEDDTLIGTYLQAAVDRMDGYSGLLGRCMVTQTWRQDYECWPSGPKLRLPFADVSAITSLKYSDPDDVEQTVNSSLYALHQDAEGSFLWLKSDFTGPSFNDDRPDPIRLTFAAGYGVAAAVPYALKAAILLMVGDFYEHRENTLVGVGLDGRELPVGVSALIFPFVRAYR
jgi:uncharacterized phiE125 gp8 family phage protein